MLKVKLLILSICTFAVLGGALAFEVRNFDYVWLVDPWFPERGCTVKVHNYTLEPNLSSVMMTYASSMSTSTCEMRVLYTGE